MRARSWLLLLAGFALALVVTEEAEAKEPDWSYTTNGNVRSVTISADGEYIAVGSYDDKVHLFNRDSRANEGGLTPPHPSSNEPEHIGLSSVPLTDLYSMMAHYITRETP